MKNREFMQSQRGLSIIEAAVSLAVLGALLVALPLLLSSGKEAMYRVPVDVDALEDAVVGFALAKRRLPCPAAEPQSGVESCALEKGYVPFRDLGLTAPARNADDQPIAYAVSRGTVDLAVAEHTFSPSYSTSGAAYEQSPGSYSRLHINGLDFCAKLRSLALNDDTAGLQQRVLSSNTRYVNTAFLLVDPGARNMDGSGAFPAVFDGINHPAGSVNRFESSGKPGDSEYDDRVLSVSTGTLFTRLECGTRLAAVSAAAGEADFANDYWRIWAFLQEFRALQARIKAQKLANAETMKLLAELEIALTVGLAALDLAIGLAGPTAVQLRSPFLLSTQLPRLRYQRLRWRSLWVMSMKQKKRRRKRTRAVLIAHPRCPMPTIIALQGAAIWSYWTTGVFCHDLQSQRS